LQGRLRFLLLQAFPELRVSVFQFLWVAVQLKLNQRNFFTTLAVAAATKERVNAEKMSSIRVIVASGLIVDFECKDVYQLIVLKAYRGI